MNNKNNKNNKIIVLLMIGVIILVFLLIFILNYSKDDSSLSILEKKWINDNKNRIIDISVFNDVPIYGLNGNGVIFDILDCFTKIHGIGFNKISYLSKEANNLKKTKFVIVNKDYKMTKNDILLYKDKYVLVSSGSDVIDDISDVIDKRIGVFNDDIGMVSYYLSNTNNSSYKTYQNIQDMVVELNNNQIDYLAIPHNMYLNYILSNDYNIVYHIEELYKNYVLSIEDYNLLNIMKKTINIYNKNYLEEFYNKELLDTFFTYKNINDEEMRNYNTNNYNYGFVVNMPYENIVDNEYIGIISNYINKFKKITNIEFNFIKYDSIKKLRDDYKKGELDVVFANYKLDNLNVDVQSTISILKEKYVILSKKNIIVNSIKSLEKYTIDAVKYTYLYDLLNENKIKIKGYNNTDDLIRNVKEDSILILDYHTYDYYKNSKFKDYKIVYDGTLDQDYSFIVKDVKKNKTFFELFNYYISAVNFKEVQNNYNTDYMISNTTLYSMLFKLICIIVAIGSILIMLVKYNINNKRRNTKISKEDKIKYIDTMTGLKNRNYLNYNINKWDDNVIYPQSVVIIDLNNIKFINDNYGHGEGDEVIKKAAGILIVNQKEKTDIIRTDGNEFLIYMVGYSESEVVNYNRKLIKELKELPYGFGATIGYSMIQDDIKTIDDAINEATLLMREAKEKL